MFISNKQNIRLIEQIDELEKLVLELAGWAGYERSGYALESTKVKIQKIRDQRKKSL